MTMTMKPLLYAISAEERQEIVRLYDDMELNKNNVGENIEKIGRIMLRVLKRSGWDLEKDEKFKIHPKKLADSFRRK